MLLPSAAVRHRDMFGIILMVPFELEKIVVSTIILVGKFSTNFGSRAVYRAASFVCIEEAANASEMHVLFAFHDALVAMG